MVSPRAIGPPRIPGTDAPRRAFASWFLRVLRLQSTGLRGYPECFPRNYKGLQHISDNRCDRLPL